MITKKKIQDIEIGKFWTKFRGNNVQSHDKYILSQILSYSLFVGFFRKCVVIRFYFCISGMYWHIIPFQAHGCPLFLCKHLPDVFSCISLRSSSTLLPVYCWPCNFVYDVFVTGGFSCTLYSDSGSPSPFLFMVITREHFILALGERLLCLFVWACVLKLESVFFEVRAFVKGSEVCQTPIGH